MYRYHKLDADLLASGNVSIPAVVLLAVLESLTGINRNTAARGTISISNNKLADKMALSARQIKRYKRELQDAGLIQITYAADNTQTIIILHDTEGK